MNLIRALEISFHCTIILDVINQFFNFLILVLPRNSKHRHYILYCPFKMCILGTYFICCFLYFLSTQELDLIFYGILILLHKKWRKKNKFKFIFFLQNFWLLYFTLYDYFYFHIYIYILMLLTYVCRKYILF